MKSAPASPVKAAQVKSAEEEEEVIPAKSKSARDPRRRRPHEHTRKSKKRRKMRWRLPLPLSLSQRRVHRISRNRDSCRIICWWWCDVNMLFLCISPCGRGKRCLGWYMRGVGYVLGGGGGLRGAGLVRRALRWSCHMRRPC